MLIRRRRKYRHWFAVINGRGHDQTVHLARGSGKHDGVSPHLAQSMFEGCYVEVCDGEGPANRGPLVAIMAVPARREDLIALCRRL